MARAGAEWSPASVPTSDHPAERIAPALLPVVQGHGDAEHLSDCQRIDRRAAHAGLGKDFFGHPIQAGGQFFAGQFGKHDYPSYVMCIYVYYTIGFRGTSGRIVPLTSAGEWSTMQLLCTSPVRERLGLCKGWKRCFPFLHFSLRIVSKKITPHTYALVSLGCPKNLVDSERMAGLLQRGGYRLVADPRRGRLVVINTCGFIADARAESHDAIEEMLRLKKQGGWAR